MAADTLFVLVSGWPGSGKTTLARQLAAQLRLPLLAKDDIKEALYEALGPPADVAASQRLGRASVLALLKVARNCPNGAVLDSTWFDYAVPVARDLPGRLVQVRCHVPLETARTRYRGRTAARDPAHLDEARTDNELWGRTVPNLRLGLCIDVDTSIPVDATLLAARIARSAIRGGEPAAPLDVDEW